MADSSSVVPALIGSLDLDGNRHHEHAGDGAFDLSGEPQCLICGSYLLAWGPPCDLHCGSCGGRAISRLAVQMAKDTRDDDSPVPETSTSGTLSLKNSGQTEENKRFLENKTQSVGTAAREVSPGGAGDGGGINGCYWDGWSMMALGSHGEEPSTYHVDSVPDDWSPTLATVATTDFVGLQQQEQWPRLPEFADTATALEQRGHDISHALAMVEGYGLDPHPGWPNGLDPEWPTHIGETTEQLTRED